MNTLENFPIENSAFEQNRSEAIDWSVITPPFNNGDVISLQDPTRNISTIQLSSRQGDLTYSHDGKLVQTKIPDGTLEPLVENIACELQGYVGVSVAPSTVFTDTSSGSLVVGVASYAPISTTLQDGQDTTTRSILSDFDRSALCLINVGSLIINNGDGSPRHIAWGTVMNTKSFYTYDFSHSNIGPSGTYTMNLDYNNFTKTLWLQNYISFSKEEYRIACMKVMPLLTDEKIFSVCFEWGKRLAHLNPSCNQLYMEKSEEIALSLIERCDSIPSAFEKFTK